MDAATLYMVLTLPNGEQRTSTVGVPTWRACEAHVELLRQVQRADPEAPIAAYRCEFKSPYVGLTICEPRGRQCEHYTTSSRRGCEALAWIAHMRDRKLVGHCYQDPPEEEPPLRSE